MKINIPVKWNHAHRILSGNRGAEMIIAENPLPHEHFWLITEMEGKHYFEGYRILKIRQNGNCQVSAKGQPNNTGELVRGKTSMGESIEFVLARVKPCRRPETPPFNPARLPLPHRLDCAHDAMAYQSEGSRGRSFQGWAELFGWWKPEDGFWESHPASLAAIRFKWFVDSPSEERLEALLPFVSFPDEPGFE